MYVAQRPSGLAAAPAAPTTGPMMIRIGGLAISPWLLVGAAVVYYASRGAWRKLK